MTLRDPVKRRKYAREYMKRKLATDPEFKAKHLARVRRNSTKDREVLRKLIAEFRANGCAVCGETESCCLDAHHRDPATKEFNLGGVARHQFGITRAKLELEKCVCLCSNCHRKLHAGVISLN